MRQDDGDRDSCVSPTRRARPGVDREQSTVVSSRARMLPDTRTHSPMTGSNANVADRVVAVLRRVRHDPIEPKMGSALVADLGFDSLRLLELIAELEDEFGIYIPLNDVPAITTVEQAVDRVVTLLREQGRA